jgi:hypothetical protein
MASSSQPPSASIMCIGLVQPDGDVWIESASNLLSFPDALWPYRALTISFAPDVADARRQFDERPDHDVLIAVSWCVESMPFVKAALASPEKRTILARTPVPSIDWERVNKGGAPTDFREIRRPGCGPLETDAEGYADITDEVDAATAESGPVAMVVHRRGTEGVWLDTRRPVRVMGTTAFTGCLGHRLTPVPPEKTPTETRTNNVA